MKRKFIILIACLFLATNGISAKSLVLTLKNGTLVYYLLDGESNPMLRFVDGGMTIDTDKYEFSNVKNFYISNTDDPNGIEHVTGKAMQYSDNRLIIDAGEANTANVYTLDGRKVDVQTLQVNGKSIIDLNTLPQGSYIIAIGETSFKVFKK